MPPRAMPPRATPPLPRALLLDDPRFDLHAPPGHHPERPERLVAARAAVQGAAVAFEHVPAREATNEELGRVHDAAFLEQLERARGARTHLDADTYLARDSVSVARLAAGGLVDVVERVLTGPVRQGLSIARPPGHHARPGKAMGFCVFNSVAVAAAHARARGVGRVAIVDFDVHHGNGTQEMFYDDPSVLYVSTHQSPLYPGTGHSTERGGGEGLGATLNVPLTAGGGDDVYRGAFERVVLPALEEFAPELVLVSAGFDAALRDPLSEMRLDSAAFGWLTRALRRVADVSAEGRTVVTLEGGYDLVALETGLSAAILGLTGQAEEIARDVDHPDVARAATAARASFRRVT
ncbi:MAG: histone deacetylase [Myxococcales bacterium]|nr:histone deacetylase [Myxococcales bacterium]